MSFIFNPLGHKSVRIRAFQSQCGKIRLLRIRLLFIFIILFQSTPSTFFAAKTDTCKKRTIWDKVFKNGSCKIRGKQPLKSLKTYGLLQEDHTPSNFLKTVFHKFHFVHSWIFCPVWFMCNVRRNSSPVAHSALEINSLLVAKITRYSFVTRYTFLMLIFFPVNSEQMKRKTIKKLSFFKHCLIWA